MLDLSSPVARPSIANPVQWEATDVLKPLLNPQMTLFDTYSANAFIFTCVSEAGGRVWVAGTTKGGAAPGSMNDKSDTSKPHVGRAEAEMRRAFSHFFSSRLSGPI
jgi:hypothetical protein